MMISVRFSMADGVVTTSFSFVFSLQGVTVLSVCFNLAPLIMFFKAVFTMSIVARFCPFCVISLRSVSIFFNSSSYESLLP